MPYVSDAQRGFMHAEHPEIAMKWDKMEGSKNKNLPQYIHGKPENPAFKSPWLHMKKIGE